MENQGFWNELWEEVSPALADAFWEGFFSGSTTEDDDDELEY